jgi:hypothetical protein
MLTDPQMYCNCMEEVKQRLLLVESVGERSFSTGFPEFDAEFAFLQIRKSLEVIAFSSLIAHRDLYSAAHANFAQHWKAQKLLEAIEKLNPVFYPVPMSDPVLRADGTKHLVPRRDGFLTRDEFVVLYDNCSEFLHTRNPFTTKEPVVRMPYSCKQWVSRIRELLALHLVHLPNGNKWIVEARSDAPARLSSAQPV